MCRVFVWLGFFSPPFCSVSLLPVYNLRDFTWFWINDLQGVIVVFVCVAVLCYVVLSYVILCVCAFIDSIINGFDKDFWNICRYLVTTKLLTIQRYLHSSVQFEVCIQLVSGSYRQYTRTCMYVQLNYVFNLLFLISFG